MGKPMDYGAVARTYASHRWAVLGKLEPLLERIRELPSPSVIVEIGCGTGDYLSAIQEQHPQHRYHGVDTSPEMLDVARQRCPWATLTQADAARLPMDSDSAALVYAVDVVHHLEEYADFFAECSRILCSHGGLLVITDSHEDIQARTLAELFPDTVPINRERYPPLETLRAIAADHDLEFVSQHTVHGYLEFDDRLMAMLEQKAISELRLISSRSHERGMRRAEAARNSGLQWLSQTTALEWSRCLRRAVE